METKNLDWWDSPIEHFVSPDLLEEGKTAAESWEKGKDTMDVWFDSGTSWSMLSEMGVGNDRGREDGVGRRFDADLCLEGSDQHRGWFQSQLLTALGSAPAGETVSPYAALITHGMVLDQKGKKMSKSLGNIVSPMNIVKGSNVWFLIQFFIENLVFADFFCCFETGQDRTRLRRRRLKTLGCYCRILEGYVYWPNRHHSSGRIASKTTQFCSILSCESWPS